MNEVPKKVKETFAATAAMMLAAVGIPQSRINGATAAFWDEIEGRSARSITNTEPIDRLLSRKQVTEILGKSKKTVSLLCADGKLRAIYGGKDGKRITGITESSLRAYMAGK